MALGRLHDPVFPFHDLSRIARRHQHQYINAEPFAHAILDDLVQPGLLAELDLELPRSRTNMRRGTRERSGGARNGSVGTHVPGAHFSCGSMALCQRKRLVEHLKLVIDREADMGPVTRLFFAALRSAPFVRFLELLTGITGLIPDPAFFGSGVHLTAPGGILAVHADFNSLDVGRTRLRRRVNVFLYVNDDWPDEYGGHLELWDRNMSACRQRIHPSLGRLVVFSTTDFSYHGHLSALAAPHDRLRRSLALYYYTREHPQSECLDRDCDRAHSTLWQQPRGCARCIDPACRAFPFPEDSLGLEGELGRGSQVEASDHASPLSIARRESAPLERTHVRRGEMGTGLSARTRPSMSPGQSWLWRESTGTGTHQVREVRTGGGLQ